MERLKIRVEELIDRSSKLETVAFIILLVGTFLLPIFFAPFLSVPFQSGKSLLLVIVTISSLCLWVLARLKDGKFALPNNLIFLTSVGVIISYVLSTLFSASFRDSFVGQGFEIGTASMMLLFFVLMFLVSNMFRTKERIFYLYLAMFLSFFIVALFQALRFLTGPSFLSFGMFTDPISNLIGKWNDLGIFFSLSIVLSVITLNSIKVGRFLKTLIYVLFVLSMFMVAVVNFTTIWFTLAFFSLVFSIYHLSFSNSRNNEVSTDGVSESNVSSGPIRKIMKGRNIPVLPLIILLISTFFIIDNFREQAGRPVSTKLASMFNINQIEVRPNWSSTLEVSVDSLSRNPIFGTGPNKFTGEWLLSKPKEVNETLFWNTDFNFAVGLIPTFAVTTGILGIVSWILFLGAFLYVGVKAILMSKEDKLSRYLTISSFFSSLVLWTFAFFYTPSLVVLAMTFIITGVFVASVYQERIISAKSVSFVDDPKLNFISVLVMVVLLIGSATGVYFFIEAFAGATLFQKGVIALNSEGDLDKAESLVKRAVSQNPNDLYYRSLAEINLVKIDRILAQNPDSISVDKARQDFTEAFNNALQNAQTATLVNEDNYQNWTILGRVYESALKVNVQGSYESAKTAYEKSLTLNPHNPETYLILSRLEIIKGDNVKAKDYINKALAEKSNYAEAVFLLSQIQVAEGNLKEAISSAEAAATLAPNDATVFFQLGLLNYNNKDYVKAVPVFERAVALVPSYANAKYFLGLSYDRLGRKADALKQFEEIQAINPDNQEVASIIKNLKAGKSALSNIAPPANTPEKGSTLPVKEKTVKEEAE